MINKLSRKSPVTIIISITIVCSLLQAVVCFYDDTDLSRHLWLEHKNVKQLIEDGKPDKSELTPVMKSISDNHFWILRFAAILTLIFAFYFKKKDSKKYLFCRNTAVSIVILLIVSGLITWILKIFIGKPRPFTKLFDYQNITLSTRFHSFPSGHTTETFAYIVPFVYFFHYYYNKFYLSIILIIYGILASLTRIVISAHYFTDVIAGIYITSITGYLICYFFDKKSMGDYLTS